MTPKDRTGDAIIRRHICEALDRKPALTVPSHRSHLSRAQREADSRRRQIERRD